MSSRQSSSVGVEGVVTGRGVKLGGVAVLQCEHSIVVWIKVEFFGW